MVPVMYDTTSSSWVVADKTNDADSNYIWYDYTSKKWANALTVTEASRSTYLNAAPGTTVDINDILTFLVWIPRYSYAIPSGTGARSISITFQGQYATKATGTATGTSFRTHPGFTFNNSELSGIWVGKFENSIDPTTSCYTSSTNCNLPSLSIRIKPNVKPWTNGQVSTFFVAMRDMSTNGNIYGFNSEQSDTHMIMNKEWGAAAYLSMSIYGKNSEVWINNNYNPSTTGCAASSVSASSRSGTCINTYATTLGVNASTTGNIYGIYDMSGSMWEYVMSGYNKNSGYTISSNSGFSGYNPGDASTTIGVPFPADMYYNSHVGNNSSYECDNIKCYGEAQYETNAWNSDYNNGLIESRPWYVRGASDANTTSAGIFAFNYSTGAAGDSSTSRLVVVEK